MTTANRFDEIVVGWILEDLPRRDSSFKAR